MKLNQKLGLPIIGEGNPKFTHPDDKRNWDGLDLPWMAFGYGISLTPLQILTFYNAIANNGIMVKPRFIKEVRQYNQTIEKFEREVISESICSGETISIVKNMMKNVVEKKHGTAHNIYSEDISLAGKQVLVKQIIGKNRDYIFLHLLVIFQLIILNIHVPL